MLQRVTSRHRAHACGGLPGYHAPDPVAFFRRQLHAPLAFKLHRRAIGVSGGGHAHQRQRDNFLARLAQGDVLAVQEFDRAGAHLGHQADRLGRDDLHRITGGFGPVCLHRQAGFLPHVQHRQVRRAHQPLNRRRAAVVGFALGVPVFAHFVRQFCIKRGVLDVLDQQRIAAHLAVVVHAVVGVLSRKRRPVASLAQQQQPVVAKAVFLVGAGVAAQKIVHVLRAGFVQPRLQFPVRCPRLQRVAARLWQQLREAALVFGPEGLVHVENERIAGAAVA